MFRAIFLAACIAVATAAGCGGGTPNPFQKEDLQTFITGLDVRYGPGEPEQSVELSPADIPEYVNDAGLAREWQAGHRVQVLRPAENVERLFVQAELYADEEAANRRFEGERSTFVAYFQTRFARLRTETFDVSDVGERCEGVTIAHGSFGDQQQVHCQVGTVLILGRTVTEDEALGQEITKQAVREAVRRAQAALPTSQS